MWPTVSCLLQLLCTAMCVSVCVCDWNEGVRFTEMTGENTQSLNSIWPQDLCTLVCTPGKKYY